MEIQKVFSNIEDPEENLYSVLMSEDEIALYSEFQRDFARKDYEGLSNKGKEILAKRRSEYAKELKTAHSKIMNDLSNLDPSKIDTLTTNGEFSGGGIKSRYTANTVKGHMYDNSFKQLHKNNVNKSLLDVSSKAKNIMRNEVNTPEMRDNITKGIIGKNRGDSRKFIRDQKLKEANSTAEKDFQNKVTAYKQRNSQKSIAKHVEKANELKKLKNKRIAGKAALGTAAAVGLAYGGKKLYDHYKKEEEN